MDLSRRHALVALGVALAAPLACRRKRRAQGLAGALATRNAIGRSGAYHLPPGYAGASLPLLVLIHGTGSDGASTLAGFAEAANARRFLVVAPDSRRSPDGVFTWQPGSAMHEVTDDFTHVNACVDEVLAMQGVAAPTSICVAGFSGGASMAPYLATNDERYAAFAVLHGGVFPGGLGSQHPRGWISTGRDDGLRTPDAQVRHASALRFAGLDVTDRVFPGGHGLPEDERSAFLDWWLVG